MKFRTGQPSGAAGLAAISIEVLLGIYIPKGLNAFFAEFVLNELKTPKLTAKPWPETPAVQHCGFTKAAIGALRSIPAGRLEAALASPKAPPAAS